MSGTSTSEPAIMTLTTDPTLQIALLGVLLASLAGACSSGPPMSPGSNPAGAEGGDGVRREPVVAGRRARVFVMAGFDEACRSLPEPEITVTAPPAKGEVSFVPGQTTVVRTSATGACADARVTGTGIYYTARPGQLGQDTFTVSAKAAGKTTERTFTVQIVD